MQNMIEEEKVFNKKRPREESSSPSYNNIPEVKSIKDLILASKTLRFYKNIDTVMLWKIAPYLEELDSMVGLSSLKDTVFLQVIYYLQNMHKTGLASGNEEYLHTMIYGAPGHGKTNVAKIIGKIYQAMGILSEDGPFRVAYRDDFIAGYLGQTALKTKKLLDSCIGGVLFIDEIYSLAPRDNDRDIFSKEALDTLTAYLSENKNYICVIGAGYEDDIKTCFFGMNKGLERRFPWIHRIDPYTPAELTSIFIKMVTGLGWRIGITSKELTDLISLNKSRFKNAGGDIENFLSKIKMIHAKRVIGLDPEHRFVLKREDFKETFLFLDKGKKEEAHPPLSMYT